MLLSIIIYVVTCQTQSIDKLFVDWNKVTFQSLNAQMSVSDSATRDRYRNAFYAFKSYLDIADVNDCNVNSIRYTFLQKIEALSKGGNFYVIEANKSGEEVEISTYVVYSTKPGYNCLVHYVYLEGKWVEVSSKIVKFSFRDEKVLYPNGVNQESMVVSRFDKGKIVYSRYYLNFTIKYDEHLIKLLK